LRVRIAKDWGVTPLSVLPENTHAVLTHLSFMMAKQNIEEYIQESKQQN